MNRSSVSVKMLTHLATIQTVTISTITLLTDKIFFKNLPQRKTIYSFHSYNLIADFLAFFIFYPKPVKINMAKASYAPFDGSLTSRTNKQ